MDFDNLNIKDEMPDINLIRDFDPDNIKVRTDPLMAALSIGMQQMPGGIEGMHRVMLKFMEMYEQKDNTEEIDTKYFVNMMFDPDARTIDRISSLMETRFEEVCKQEHQKNREK